VTASTVDHDVSPRSGGFRHYLLGAGWIRAIWMSAAFGAFGFGLTVGLRWWGDWQPIFKWTPIVLVSILVCAPLGFPRRDRDVSTTGRATRSARRRFPTTTRVTGATSWKDYFKVNTDHKVIGVQYPRDDGLLLRDRRDARAARPRRAREAGHAVRRSADVQRPLLGARVTDDLPLRDPPPSPGSRTSPVPADARRAPTWRSRALNALSFWLLPIAGLMMLSSFVVPGGALRVRLDGLRTALLDAPAARRGVLQPGRAVGRGLVRDDGTQLPGHDHHDGARRA